MRWVLVLVLVFAALEALNLVSAERSLQDGSARLTEAAHELGTSPSEWTRQRIAAAALLQDEAQKQIDNGRNQVQLDPLLRVLSILPLAGDQVGAVYHLADGGSAGARALGDTLAVARAYEGAGADPSLPPGARVLKLLAEWRAPLEDARQALDPAVTALEADRTRRVVGVLRRREEDGIRLLGPVHNLATLGAAAGRYAPGALGAAGPRTYLVLLPNPGELRPAGGFAGAAGAVTFTAGQPSAINIEDSDQLDRHVHGAFAPPPALSGYMPFNYGRVNMGDNLEPDFPRQAAMSEAMYTSATGTAVAGTIAIDPYGVSALLGVTGPVQVPGYGTFDAGNVFQKLDIIVNVQQGPGSGKGALGPISAALLRHVLSTSPTLYPALLAALEHQAIGRHLQVSMHEPALARALAAAHFDGALRTPADDYLMVADANIGATKGDLYIHKQLSVKAEYPSSGLSRHSVTMTYDLPPPVDAIDRALNPQAGQYRDYVRFYLPVTSTVARVSYRVDGRASPASVQQTVEADGKLVVAAYFVLDRGHRADVEVAYTAAVQGGTSDGLLVQKQAGIAGYPLLLSVSYPGGRQDRSLTLDRDQQAGWTW
jgi:hypothetical protein